MQHDGNIKSLPDLQVECMKHAEIMGWHDNPITFLDAMFLLMSECFEAGEAWRDHGFADMTPQIWFGDKPPKPEGVGSEFADILMRLLHYAAYFGIDLMTEYERKREYNLTRGHRHGGKLA